MNLGKNVYNLLKRQAAVYVDGLGTFRRNRTAAVYDEQRHVYLPPISYIDFDRGATDGYDFIQYIQQLSELDRSTAEHLVSQAVTQIQRHINEEGQVKLDDLGYLVSYGDGYVFKPLDLSGFHLEAVSALPQQGNIEKIRENTEVPPAEDNPAVAEEPAEVESYAGTEPEVTATTIAPEGQNESPEIETREGVEEQIAEEEIKPLEEIVEEEPRKSNNSIWYIVLVVVALGIMAALYLANKNTFAPKELEVVDTIPVIKDTVDSAALHLVPDSLSAIQADSTVTDTVVVALEKEVVQENRKANHEWQIVIGTHRTLAQAYEQAESYNKAGYPKVHVVPSNLAKNKKKVIWDSYETKAQADSALVYVQKHIIKDAWPDKIGK
ncbi:hypothetical protein [Sphingobacterium psychroaquaticum]|uniref:Uncharacterized protein n=1 Tax=Sphingobacterium psychroaquaticum TaxID=561061 RepID=A0A1X7KN24_9SPHI|nr:hypothetical protein [Sphingobacterium psychroaquaticum]SMG42894.1 hypothetical protein SAMN05660862_3050 [Sphingobacterium psychroaquaticum]